MRIVSDKIPEKIKAHILCSATYLFIYFTYLLTHSLHGAQSFLRS